MILTCRQENKIGEGGVEALSRAVEHNSSLIMLSIGVSGDMRQGEERGDKRVLLFHTNLFAGQ